jgi:hypothetical protein
VNNYMNESLGSPPDEQYGYQAKKKPFRINTPSSNNQYPAHPKTSFPNQRNDPGYKLHSQPARKLKSSTPSQMKNYVPVGVL